MVRISTAVVAGLLLSAAAAAQTSGTFKLAYYNIQSGKGEPPLRGRTSTFADTTNCTDTTKPLNAWGVGVVQRELRERLASDPAIVALGLSEAWTCASPAQVRTVLGWKGVSSERNGIGVVARHGFAGPEQWQQLDTTLNDNPKDTMWVVVVPVCLDAGCSAAVQVAVTHWYATFGSPDAATTYDRQAAGTVAFLAKATAEPHVLIGDLNSWESPAAIVCDQVPLGAGLTRLREAGYTDAWPRVHGQAEGFTGMLNRAACGTPEGYAWKRIDYAWSSPGYAPVSMTRFGMVPAGDEAPSDHYGVIVEYRRSEGAPPSTEPAASDVIMYASQAPTIAGDWRITSDATAAGGHAIENPERGAAKRLTALAAPADFFEATFFAERARPYRIWMRGQAASNAWTNDSVFVQFNASVSATGEAIWRTGTTSATIVTMEECSGCGLAGWGWADNGYGTLGPLVYFAQTGVQTIRVQPREDGITIDQIVLSPETYLTSAPGLPKNDATILGQPSPPPSSALEIVRYAGDATDVAGDWVRVTDALAAGGIALRNPDRAAPKVAAPLATPATYLEVTFDAEARRPYRLWLRGRADANSWSNDSVYVQFSGSVTDTGVPTWRIGSTSATAISIEECPGCGLSAWGWQDNGYGAGVLGPLVYFETTGPQTLRIQQREDGISIDQIVLSADRYLTTRPGLTKDDTTILQR